MFYRVLTHSLVVVVVICFSSCGSEDSDDPIPEPQIDCSTLGLALSASTSAGCSSLGSVEVSASGGESPYTFAVDGSSFQSSPAFADLTAGSYSFSVKDANDCTASLSVTVEEEANDLSISASPTATAGCGTNAGEIEVTLNSGAGAIEYSVNGGAFSNNAVFTGLSADTYEIIARNEEGCETTTSTQVLTGITLSNHVQNIVDTNCALPACHGGTQLPDFRQKSNILNNANNIATRTANGTMPPTGALSQEMIDTIACWVADGAQDN
jgi:hypothetical protein